jgi:hypothetical protein
VQTADSDFFIKTQQIISIKTDQRIIYSINAQCLQKNKGLPTGNPLSANSKNLLLNLIS